tara:strand:- start:301 stop:564 length:264 start_codon:yes stop_codon:yes gene_type:complete
MTKILIATPDGQEVRDMTAEEEAQRQADISAETARKQAEADAKQAEADAKVAQDAVDAQTATDKASAKVKLKAAEYTPLTEAEADAL